VSLTDYSRDVIYSCNMFMLQDMLKVFEFAVVFYKCILYCIAHEQAKRSS
jgi:hypothetical protein